jgi:threonine-phosphate decarboxylase
MSSARDFSHGGLVDEAARRLGVAPEKILDFSANLNPAGLPERAAARLAREAANPLLISRYPDPEVRELKLALAARNDVSAETIVIGAGADALIHAALRALAPRACIVPVPAFAEYERACATAGIAVRRVGLKADDGFRLQPHAWRVGAEETIVFNNPHNPTGACATRSEMLDRIATARSNGATVLVDEAFVDYAPEAVTTRDAAAQSGVIAIRSLTKFYGCAGLRVGYAAASPETALALQGHLPPLARYYPRREYSRRSRRRRRICQSHARVQRRPPLAPQCGFGVIRLSRLSRFGQLPPVRTATGA